MNDEICFFFTLFYEYFQHWLNPWGRNQRRQRECRDGFRACTSCPYLLQRLSIQIQIQSLHRVGKVKVKGHPLHKMAKLSASRVIHPSIHSSIHPEANFQMCEWSTHQCPLSKEFLYLNRNHRKRTTWRK